MRPRSLLRYYGQNAVIWTFIPAFCFLIVCAFLSSILLEQYFLGLIAEAYPDADTANRDLLFAQMENVALGVLSTEDGVLQSLATDYAEFGNTIQRARGWLVILLSLGLAGFAYLKAMAKFRARE